MEIIHVSAECYPVAKVGGLADVVGALPKYQNRLGHFAKVVVPAYDTKFVRESDFEVTYDAWSQYGNNSFQFRVLKEKTNKLGFDLYIVHIQGLTDRPNVYGYDDDTERFIAFQIATLDWIAQWEHRPDVIHCHDHHTGLIPFMMKNSIKYQHLSNVPSILTIHNAQYQGQFGWDKLYYLPAFDLWKAGLLEWDKDINPLASAIKCAWRVTTVSPSYLDEMMNNARGLESLLRQERWKCSGILNGIDTEVWNPETDPMLGTNFNLKTVEKGKQENKNDICNVFGLDASKPLFAFIGRLVDEKGADLLPDIFYSSLYKHGKDIGILVLGSGDGWVEGRLNQIKDSYKGNYNVYIGYNEALSHQIYAGADFLLMPSRVEPCGLNQLYSLRYGTVPIVRRIGGLKDTVIDIGDDGFGICHDQTNVWDVTHAIDRGLQLFNDKKKFKATRKTIMKIDHSWDKAANNYIELYQILK
ncbi:glycogen synthase [Pedobacter changchengzhani]|uniref:Glycogen synthase n=1 Tax=Pedobacter changchengzhani TaxID=2529274 RepID=A0A4R5MNX3_9SPHI|nr:glycogen synthase [Pedobacter changchengzhani]TDG37035.1 glycogen synthase [Pedobacter changchengzhani]